jgi:N-acetylglutamate synthase-like GNAT family acetyltransferase
MIRKAVEEDIEVIYKIYLEQALDYTKLNDTEYLAQVERNGFVLGLDKIEEFEEQITGAKMFLVHEEDGQILGFAIADNRDKFQDNENKIWFDPEIKKNYFNEKMMTLTNIAVGKNSFKKGVGRALLEHIEKELKQSGYQYLFSIITISPILNSASVIFHTRNGFKKTAMIKPSKLGELENYVPMLFYKII